MGLNLIPTCEKNRRLLWLYFPVVDIFFFFALFPADRDDMGEKGQLEAAGIIIR